MEATINNAARLNSDKRVTCAQRILVIFRNDDPSALSNLAHEREIFGIFERFGAPQTLAVIPKIALTDLHDPAGCGERSLLDNTEMLAFLKDYVLRSGSEVALHGCTHRTNRHSIPSRREYFEFRRLSLTEQEGMIREGTQILERAFGFRPITFVPPWNRMDHNTVEACARQGYKIVSAGPFMATKPGLLSLGVNTDLHRFRDDYQAAKKGRSRVILNILLHSSTLTEKQKGLLIQALELVSNDDECKAVTIARAAEIAPETAGLVNDAARSFAPLHEVVGSSRAKAWPYVAALRRIFGRDLVGPSEREAEEFYRRGEYLLCAERNRLADRASYLIVFSGRVAAMLLGVLLAFCSTRFLRPQTFSDALSMAGAVIGLCALGFLASRAATAIDTRREIIAGGCFCALGFLACAVGVYSLGPAH